MSYQIERYYAEMEAARNEAERAYFDARPALGDEPSRQRFKDGYERAFHLLWLQLTHQETQFKKLQEAAKGVFAFDWVGNDPEPCGAIDLLRNTYYECQQERADD